MNNKTTKTTETNKTTKTTETNPFDMGLVFRRLQHSEKYHSQFENAMSCEAHHYYHNTECPCLNDFEG